MRRYAPHYPKSLPCIERPNPPAYYVNLMQLTHPRKLLSPVERKSMREYLTALLRDYPQITHNEVCERSRESYRILIQARRDAKVIDRLRKRIEQCAK
jgi:hypothetical protein